MSRKISITKIESTTIVKTYDSNTPDKKRIYHSNKGIDYRQENGSIILEESKVENFPRIMFDYTQLEDDLGATSNEEYMELMAENKFFANFNGGGAAPTAFETQNKLIQIGLNQLGVNTFEEVTYDILAAYITFLNITVEKGENYYFEVVDFVEEEVVNYNFDITANGWNSEGITNQASFINWLETRVGNSLNNIVVTDFNLTGNRLACNLTADGLSINLGGIIALNVDGIGNIIGLETISLDYNYLSFIDLSLLPQTATLVYLGSNQLSSSSYISMEASASALPNFTNTCTIFFGANLNSINGTNLKTILESKNCIVSNS